MAKAQERMRIPPSRRKQAAFPKLLKLGLKISDGTDYRLEEHVEFETTLADVRKALSIIKGSLSRAIVHERARG